GLAGLPLDLAAGSLWDAAGFEQHDGTDHDFMPLGDRPADGSNHFLGRRVAPAALQLMGDDQALPVTISFDRKRGPARRTEGRVAALDRLFNVVRIMIAAEEDDEVFEPPRDEQFAAVDEAQVARAQERAVSVGRDGPEGERRFVRPPPVTLGDARSGDPDFTELVGGARGQRVRL